MKFADTPLSVAVLKSFWSGSMSAGGWVRSCQTVMFRCDIPSRCTNALKALISIAAMPTGRWDGLPKDRSLSDLLGTGKKLMEVLASHRALYLLRTSLRSMTELNGQLTSD